MGNWVFDFPRKTTVEIAVATPETKTLVDLVSQYGLVDRLSKTPRSTIFAPTNGALKSLVTYATWNTIEVTSEIITKILEHHVVPERLYKSDLATGGKVPKGLDNEEILPSQLDVAAYDVRGTNGNIHVINK